jgi:hypothetical protein
MGNNSGDSRLSSTGRLLELGLQLTNSKIMNTHQDSINRFISSSLRSFSSISNREELNHLARNPTGTGSELSAAQNASKRLSSLATKCNSIRVSGTIEQYPADARSNCGF